MSGAADPNVSSSRYSSLPLSHVSFLSGPQRPFLGLEVFDSGDSRDSRGSRLSNLLKT